MHVPSLSDSNGHMVPTVRGIIVYLESSFGNRPLKGKKNLNVNLKFLKVGKSSKPLNIKYFQSPNTLRDSSSGYLSSYWLALEIRKILLLAYTK